MLERTACRRLTQEQAQELAAARDAVAGDDESALDELPKELGRCLGTAGGAWAVVARNLSPYSSDSPDEEEAVRGVDGSLIVAFATRDAYAESELMAASHPFSDLKLQTFTYDWNHDGTAELAACWSATLHVGQTSVSYPQRDCRLFRFDRQRRVVDSIAPVTVTRFADVDADGRPDIVTFDPFRIQAHTYSTENCSMCLDDDVAGPELVLHALPDGTFSATDRVAIAHARSGCPTSPIEYFPGKCDARVFAEGWKYFACAVLRGEPREHLQREARRARANCCSDQRYCPEVDSLDDYAKQPPLPALLR